ncbi:MAG: HlyD family secretion protein [Planctomycetes bacterium]|nr:HlyD family secretion protein [Planctomycetota bacterium]
MPTDTAQHDSLDVEAPSSALADWEAEPSPLSDTLAAMPSWMSRSLIYVCICFLGIGLAFAYLARIDVVTVAPAVVTPLGRLKPVQTELEGIVTELLVEEGDRVAAGEPLAVVDSQQVVSILAAVRASEQALAEVHKELEEVIPLKERQFQARIAILRQQIAGHNRRQAALREQLARETEALELARRQHELGSRKQDETIKRLRLQRTNAEAALELSTKLLQRIERLAFRDAATELDLLTTRRKHEQAQAEVEKLASMIAEAEVETQIQGVSLRTKINEHEKATAVIREELAESEVAAGAADLEIRQRQDELELVRLETRLKRDALAFKLDQARRSAGLNLSGVSEGLLDKLASGTGTETDRHRVLSPVDGLVGRIVVTEGAAAQRGATLMTLVPDDARLVAEVRVPNREMGRVREGLPVRLKFDAFPYAEHGAIGGRLTRLVKVAEDSGPASSAQVAPAGGGSWFRAYCMLDQHYFRVRGERKPLLPGMTARAEIVTERKRILEILLKPLLEFQQGRRADR